MFPQLCGHCRLLLLERFRRLRKTLSPGSHSPSPCRRRPRRGCASSDRLMAGSSYRVPGVWLRSLGRSLHVVTRLWVEEQAPGFSGGRRGDWDRFRGGALAHLGHMVGFVACVLSSLLSFLQQLEVAHLLFYRVQGQQATEPLPGSPVPHWRRRLAGLPSPCLGPSQAQRVWQAPPCPCGTRAALSRWPWGH